MSATKKTTASPRRKDVSVDLEASDAQVKRAKRLGYDLPEVPETVVLEDQTPKVVTVEKSSPMGKRAKRLGYELPESPETVVEEGGAISVPLGSGDKS